MGSIDAYGELRAQGELCRPTLPADRYQRGFSRYKSRDTGDESSVSTDVCRIAGSSQFTQIAARHFSLSRHPLATQYEGKRGEADIDPYEVRNSVLAHDLIIVAQ